MFPAWIRRAGSRLRALALSLLAGLVLVAGAAPAPVPCRNLKSHAQCEADERELARQRPSVGADKVTEVRTPGVVTMERILVEADPEDLPAPEATRWEKFDRALKGAIYTEVTGNDGVRMICVDPCPRRVNCCVRGREFNTTGREAGR
jgi:hypothetical protein